MMPWRRELEISVKAITIHYATSKLMCGVSDISFFAGVPLHTSGEAAMLQACVRFQSR
jgi:hypothetical protein